MNRSILAILFLLFAVPSFAMVTEKYEDGRAATIVTGMQRAYFDMPLCTIYDREYKYADNVTYHYIVQGLLTKSSWDKRDVCFLPVRRGGHSEEKQTDSENTNSDGGEPQETCETNTVCDEPVCESVMTCDDPVCRMELVCKWRHHRYSCERERVCSPPLCMILSLPIFVYFVKKFELVSQLLE